MAAGSLTLEVTDLRGRPVAGRLRVDLKPHASSAGGSAQDAVFPLDGHQVFTVDGIECRSGLGTLYEVRLDAPGYKRYAFLQLMKPGTKNLPSEPAVRLMVNPRKVRDIVAADFAALPIAFRRGLENASMQALDQEDGDLVGLSGASLYAALGPLRKACLLNLVAKATHPSADRVARFVKGPVVLRQDRCFAEADPAMHTLLCKSERYKSAPSLLHEPPKGFERLESFKSRDPHGNLQVTFMQKKDASVLWADIDIDEASGIEHGFEVIRNAVVDKRTNPFLVRELLLASRTESGPIDPGYDFVL